MDSCRLYHTLLALLVLLMLAALNARDSNPRAAELGATPQYLPVVAREGPTAAAAPTATATPTASATASATGTSTLNQHIADRTLMILPIYDAFVGAGQNSSLHAARPGAFLLRAFGQAPNYLDLVYIEQPALASCAG
jgi:hypothetical protein